MKIRLLFCLVIVLKSLAVTNVIAEEPTSEPTSSRFSFGHLHHAYDALQTCMAARELSLELDFLRSIQQPRKQFLRSREVKETRRRLGKIRRYGADVEDLYKIYKSEGENVREFNQRVLAEIDTLLDSARKSRSFRKILTIHLLQIGELEEVLMLHEVEVPEEKFGHLLKRKAEIERELRSKGDNHSLYDVSLRSIGEELSEADIKLYSGELYTKPFPVAQSVVGHPVSQYYQDTILRFILDPKIQLEIGLTLSQVRDLTQRRKELEDKFGWSQATQISMSGAKANEITGKLKQMRSGLQTTIFSKLTMEQSKRLKQLLFQYYVGRVDHPWALWVAGKGMRPGESKPEIFTESEYVEAALAIRANLRLLKEVVGEKRAGSLIGKVIVPPNTIEREPLNERIRLRVEREYLSNVQPKRPTNPRRRSQSR